jgi:hypothetical protein
MSGQQDLISGDRYLSELLLFFLRAVRKYLLLVVLLPPVAAALAFFIARQLSPVYGAQASIPIGRVDGSEFLSSQAATARINSRAFREHVGRSMSVPPGDDQAAGRLPVGLAAQPESSDSVAGGAPAATPQQVRHWTPPCSC